MVQLLIEGSIELPGQWMCTAIVKDCVVCNNSNVDRTQHVDSWTIEVDVQGRATWFRMVLVLAECSTFIRIADMHCCSRSSYNK